MNKGELAAKVAQQTGLTKKNAEKAVGALVAAIQGALVAGESVQLVGFGTFSVRTRPARMGRNPRTGKSLQIPETKSPAFKAGKSLKDAVKKG